MTTMRYGKFKLVADERTSTMPLEALICRGMNHPWTRIPTKPSRKAELRKLGQTESHWFCSRCGVTRIDLFELPQFTTLSSKIDYSGCPGYLVAEKGAGRLPRSEARKALFMRDDPALV